MKKSNGQPNASDCPLSSTSSACAKGCPPSPNKKASKVGTNTDNSLLIDQTNDASDFLNWKELPQDVHDRMKACKDKLTMQTSSSLTRFRNDLTVETDANREVQQREWNFILFPLAGEKICMSQSGFKLNHCPCPKEQQKTRSMQFPKMEKEDVQH